MELADERHKEIVRTIEAETRDYYRMPAIGTLHLSGARIASIDRNAMADAILTQATPHDPL